jgi:hypothetical protein
LRVEPFHAFPGASSKPFHEGGVVFHISQELVIIFFPYGLNEVFLFPVENQIQSVGVGDVFFNVVVAVKEEEILLIPSHLQYGAVEFLRYLEELHGGAETIKIAIVDGDQEGYKHKAHRKGYYDLAPYRRWKYSHRITIAGFSKKISEQGGKGAPRRPFAGRTS